MSCVRNTPSPPSAVAASLGPTLAHSLQQAKGAGQQQITAAARWERGQLRSGRGRAPHSVLGIHPQPGSPPALACN
jgi:hypothetical protein